jgi:amino acid transporter
LLGLFVAAAFSWSKLSSTLGVLQTSLSGWQITAVYVFGAVIILSPIAVYLVTKKAIKRNKKYKTLFKSFIFGNIVAGIALLFCGLVASQKIAVYSQVWVSVLVVSAWIIFLVILAGVYISTRKTESFEIKSNRKEAWLKKAGKKKK